MKQTGSQDSSLKERRDGFWDPRFLLVLDQTECDIGISRRRGRPEGGGDVLIAGDGILMIMHLAPVLDRLYNRKSMELKPLVEGTQSKDI